MKNFRTSDPFVENEYFAKRAIEEPEEDPSFRLMTKKAVILHESYDREKPDEIEVWKKKDCLEIKICTWQQHQQVSRVRCDQDHFHNITREEELWLETIRLDWDKAKKLAQWILGQETN
jgi:hypothetical protein